MINYYFNSISHAHSVDGHGRSEGIRIDVDSFDSYVQDIVSYMSDNLDNDRVLHVSSYVLKITAIHIA